jgi:alpha-galactosidase
VSPYDGARAVLLYVSENKTSAILFNYQLNTRRKDIFGRVQLQGLDPLKKYRFREINLFPGTPSTQPDNDKVFTGGYLMSIGLNLSPKPTALTSNIFELVAE